MARKILSVIFLLDFLRQILNDVAHCHSFHVIYRDLKSNNLLVDFETNVIKLSGFGSSKPIGLPTKG